MSTLYHNSLPISSYLLGNAGNISEFYFGSMFGNCETFDSRFLDKDNLKKRKSVSGDRKEKGNEWQMVSFFSEAFLRKIEKNAASTNRPWNCTSGVLKERVLCTENRALQ